MSTSIEWKKPDQFSDAERAWSHVQNLLEDYGGSFDSYDGWDAIDSSTFRFRINRGDGHKFLVVTASIGWDADCDDGNWRDCSRVESIAIEEEWTNV